MGLISKNASKVTEMRERAGAVTNFNNCWQDKINRRNKIEKPKNDTDHQQQDCISCKGKCCKYVALEIDKPTCKRDYDHIRWYLMHENIQVFIDHDGLWTLEFITRCRNLNSKYRCSIYPERPKLCSQYPPEDLLCEYSGRDLPHAELFTCSEEFERYLKKRGIPKNVWVKNTL